MTEPTPLINPAAIARRIDPGWLFLVVGVVVLAASALLPAEADLREARWQRDRAHAIEQHRLDRLARYAEYLAALERQDERLLLALAAAQLNQTPPGKRLLFAGPVALRSASVFPLLEPPPVALPPKPEPRSILERLVLRPDARPWAVVVGSVCVLVGLLPSTAERNSTRRGSGSGTGADSPTARRERPSLRPPARAA